MKNFPKKSTKNSVCSASVLMMTTTTAIIIIERATEGKVFFYLQRSLFYQFCGLYMAVASTGKWACIYLFFFHMLNNDLSLHRFHLLFNSKTIPVFFNVSLDILRFHCLSLISIHFLFNWICDSPIPCRKIRAHIHLPSFK